MSKPAKSQRGQIRIIGGQWRGRKLPVADWEGLRPTSDRIRETLFNWLTPYVAGAACVDLFAGSGALGLEALSRGANSCLFIDKNPQCCDAIRQRLADFGASSNTAVHCGNAAVAPLKTGRYDLAFIDPPFHANLVDPTLTLLKAGSFLTNDALIYVETEKGLSFDESGLERVRSKTAGDVDFHLFRSQR